MAAYSTTLGLDDKMSPVLKSVMRSLGTTLHHLEQIESQTNTTGHSKSFDAMKRSIDDANMAMRKFERESELASQATGQAGSAVRSMTTDVNTLKGSANGVSGIFSTWKNDIVRAGIALLAVQKLAHGIKFGVSASDEYMQTQARIANMVGGREFAGGIQEQIFNAAQSSRAHYADMSATVAKLGTVASDKFTDTDELIKFTELMNKSFVVGGAAPQEQSAAMYQLTQAIASGRLQGDEFRTIREAAPLLQNYIAQAMGAGVGDLKELGSEGEITAEVIKKAMFLAADEIEGKFEQIPLTAGQMATQTANAIQKKFWPAMEAFNRIVNNPTIQTAMNVIVNAAGAVSTALTLALVGVDNLITALGHISPVISAIITATLGYFAVMIGSMLPKLISGIYLAAGAWLAMNWPILAIIGTISLVIYTINQMGITVRQIVEFAGSMIGGMIAYLYNAFVETYNSIAMVAEFVANAFIDPVGTAIRLFSNFANTVLGIVESIANALDSVFGSNLVKTVSDWRVKVAQDAIKYENKPVSINRMEYMDISETMARGAQIAGSVYDKVANFAAGLENLPSNITLGGVSVDGGNLDFIGKIKDNEVTISEEDIKLLKDVAAKEFSLNYSQITPQMHVTFGDVRETADVNGILTALEDMTEQAMYGRLVGAN